MKFGIALTTSVSPVFREFEQKEYILEVAEISEARGYESVWVSDRTVYPNDIAERYPDQFGKGKADPNSQNVMESLITLSFIAGKTQKLLLGTSVLVLPFRNPLLNTKMISTLDVLSDGRLIIGVGTGWMQEEFDSMGADYPNRGTITDEHIELIAKSARDSVPSYHGQFIETTGMKIYPQNYRGRSVPIWVGGNSDKSLVRTVKFGSAWHGINLTPSQLKYSRDKLNQICETYQRDHSEISTTLRATVKITGQPNHQKKGRAYLTGNLDQIADDLQQYERAGLDYLVISMSGDSTNEVISAISKFGDRFI